MKFIDLLLKEEGEVLVFNLSQLKSIHFFPNQTAVLEIDVDGNRSYDIDTKDNVLAKFIHFLNSELLVFTLESL